IPAPSDPWADDAARADDALDGLVYRSNLLGADRALANQGGGNTSAKQTVPAPLGRGIRLLWVKGSGTDLATIGVAGFAGLRLEELLPLRERDEMDAAALWGGFRASAARAR